MAAIKDKLYVQVSSLKLRDKPSVVRGTVKGSYSKNKLVHQIESSVIPESANGHNYQWIHVSIDDKVTGYMCKSEDGTIYLGPNKVTTNPNTGKVEKQKNDQVQDTSKATETVKDKQTKDEEKAKEDAKNTVDSYSTYQGFNTNTISDDYLVNVDNIDDLVVSNIVGIYGMPYQFMPTVDIRLNREYTLGANNQDGIGRKYAERIVNKMPLVLFTPGIPEFLEGYTDEEKKGLLARLINYGESGNYEGDIKKIIDKPGRYYTFKFDYAGYFNYVEPMLWACAKFLGIENETMTVGDVNGKLGSFRWRDATNDKLSTYIFSRQYIPFYVDSVTSVNESFSTSTTQSSLAGTLNNLSDMAKEVMFLTGNYTNHAVGVQNIEEFNSTKAKIDDLVNNSIFKDSKLIDGLVGAATTIASGGKLYFPEIWSDTEFSKDYNIDIKLRTPDGDILSWYMNICVPIIHLLGLAAPRELGNPNMYTSPFLVRAYYKGIFNCDMGIVTNMSINKGKEGSWTIDGLPTEVDVSLTLKDLYSVFCMSDAVYSSAQFVKNIGMIDYLANTCGININKPELTRSIDLWLLLKSNVIKQAPRNIMQNWNQASDNMIRKVYESGVLSK